MSGQVKAVLRDTITILLAAAAIFVALQFTVQRYVVEGPSMLNSFHNGQQLLVNKVVYHIEQPKRGDVVIFDSPVSKNEEYIKRIIGLPGESVEIDRGVVKIHEKDGNVLILDEPYITLPYTGTYHSGVIPDGLYFVLGDNRANSSDSRSGWLVPIDSVVGKVWLSVWPISDVGLIPSYAYSEN